MEAPGFLAVGLGGEGAKSVGPPRAMEAEVGAAKEFRTLALAEVEAAGALPNRWVVAMLFLDLGMMGFVTGICMWNRDCQKVRVRSKSRLSWQIIVYRGRV